MRQSERPTRPTLAVAMGDPAGVSSELLAKLLIIPEVLSAAHIVIFGDRRILESGAEIAGVAPQYDVVPPEAHLPRDPECPILVDLANLDPSEVQIAKATLAGGRFATENFRRALQVADHGSADAVFFTPFNKKAMRLAYDGYDDEIRFINDVLGRTITASEFNILGHLWNARVTSHIPLAKVADAISEAAILRSLRLTDENMKAAGFDRPRIAVAALNPHAGDGGNFGREEIEILEPAIHKAAAEGLAVEGPFPSDTVFLRAKNGDYDAVLTMYHDQGQIAMKLMGFERGVTLLGGYPFPICTPAHGTAYDIAGRGIANSSAAREAFLIAARAASRRTMLEERAREDLPAVI